MVTGRKYPFGNHIKDSLLSLPPKVDVKIESESQRQGKRKLGVATEHKNETPFCWYGQSSVMRMVASTSYIVVFMVDITPIFAGYWLCRRQSITFSWENKVLLLSFMIKNLENYCFYYLLYDFFIPNFCAAGLKNFLGTWNNGEVHFGLLYSDGRLILPSLLCCLRRRFIKY